MLPSPSRERVAQVVSYDPDTGLFRLRNPHRNKRNNERDAGFRDRDGYVRLRIDNRNYGAHRIAWLLVHGEWPAMLDHKNGDPADNRIDNLRLANRSENRANAKVGRNNSIGFKGVTLDRSTGRYRSSIKFKRRLISLGTFDTPEQAHAAYVAKAEELFGEFARAG